MAFAAASLLGAASAQGGNTPVCAGCHRDVWETYRRTGMARSFYRPSAENMVEDFNARNTFYHQPSQEQVSRLLAHRPEGKSEARAHLVACVIRDCGLAHL